MTPKSCPHIDLKFSQFFGLDIYGYGVFLPFVPFAFNHSYFSDGVLKRSQFTVLMHYRPSGFDEYCLSCRVIKRVIDYAQLTFII